MINSIQLHNFRTHRHLDEPLGPLTYVVGPNDCGKTNVVRGLKWALLNDGVPLEEMATFGESSCSVAVRYPTVKITRERDKSKNAYRIETPTASLDKPAVRQLDKVGQGILPEILELTGVRPITAGRSKILLHFQGVNCLAPLDLPPSDLAHLLTAISGAGPVEDAARTAVGKAREFSSRIKQAEESVARAEETVTSLAGAAHLPPLVDTLETWERACQDHARQVRVLSTLRERVLSAEEAPQEAVTDQLATLVAEVDSASSLVATSTQRLREMERLQHRVDRCLSAPPQTAVDGLSQLVSAVEAHVLDTPRLRALQALVSRAQSAEEKVVSYRDAAEKAVVDFDTALKAAGKCPVCGKDVG